MRTSLASLFSATFFLVAALPALAQSPSHKPPEFRLGDAVIPTSYALHLAIDPRESTFGGDVRIAMKLTQRTAVIWMHGQKLEIAEAVFVQGDRRARARVMAAPDQLVGFEIEGGLEPGEATAEIRWRAPIEELATRGLFRQREGEHWYAVTQLESTSARLVLPSFDEPGWKTPWQLTIDAPDADRVVSNTPEERASPVEGRPGWTRHVFMRTRPLPTYLVALAVGPFDVVEGGSAGKNGTPLRYVVSKGRGIEATFARATTPGVLDSLERYFGIPYPFEKLDSVSIPATVGFGAMENVGMITYSSELLMARPGRESLAFKRAYASVGAHEIAHQWFGDLVTLAWWDDIWLNEAFATWMARKTLQDVHPEWQRGWRAGDQRRRALDADRVMSARRIANPVLNRNDISSAFDAITYQKGCEVLSMFEAWLGPDRFRMGVQRFLGEHAYANATSADFFRTVGEASGRGEAAVAAFRSFVDQPGAPLVDVKLQCRPNGASLQLDQHRLIPKGTSGTEGRWSTPACFRYGIGGKSYRQCTEIVGAQALALEQRGCPDWVVGNADGAGHWVPRYDAATLDRILKSAKSLPEAEAVALGGDAALLMTSGLLSARDALRIAEALFAHRAIGAQHAAVDIVDHVRDDALQGRDLATFRRLQSRPLAALARRVGWTPRPGEGLDTQELRELLLPHAAVRGGERALGAEARKLAERALADPAAVDPSISESVLRTASRLADPPMYARLEAALASTTDRRERVHLVKALAAVREPALRDRSLALLLKPEALDGRDAATYLEAALGDWWNGDAALAYFTTHWDAISARLPAETTSRLMRAMVHTCTPAARDRFQAFFGERAAKFSAGPRSYAQALERMDICIAASAAR